MRANVTILQKHASDFWLARGAIALTAALNLVLVNNVTIGLHWLVPALAIALLAPLWIATAWMQKRMQQATTHHHWSLVVRHRRYVRGFSLWFWNLDHGGPAIRGLYTERAADFLFPQMIAGKIDGAGQWTPGFIGYFYVSFTNATAFSPTNRMPLSARSKLHGS